MRRHQQRCAVSAADAIQQLQNAASRIEVQIAGGFVGNDQRWFVHDGACDRHTLLFSARQFIGKSISALANVQLLEQPLRALSSGAQADAVHAQAQSHVLQHRQCRQQVEELEYEAESAPSQQ